MADSSTAGKSRKRRRSSASGKENREGKILVKICGKENGLEEYENVNFIRIISRRYNLLIMSDYLPVIGELEGSVFFRTAKREYRRENLKGYFMHKNNEFSLMLREEGTASDSEYIVEDTDE